MLNIPKNLIPSTSTQQKIKRVRLTIDEIKQLPDAELLKLLSGESSTGGVISAPLLQAISYELTSRQIERSSKPHWTVKPTFYAVIFFGLVTIAIGVLSLLK